MNDDTPQAPAPRSIRRAARSRIAASTVLGTSALLLGVHAAANAGALGRSASTALLLALPALLAVLALRSGWQARWLRAAAAGGASGDASRLSRLTSGRPLLGGVGAGLGSLILAVVATPVCACVPEAGPDALVRSQLRELLAAQEIHYQAAPASATGAADAALRFRYATTPSALGIAPPEGVDLRLTSRDPAEGYAAVASHSSGLVCSVWVGEANRTPPATEEGRIRCADPPEPFR